VDRWQKGPDIEISLTSPNPPATEGAPVELAEYLEAVQENPWTFPSVAECLDPPPEWVAAAWDTEAVQESIACDMALARWCPE
jgi:hypothetical protein